MIRVLAILLTICFAAPAAKADALSVRDYILSELRDDGYREVKISRTLLGRMRFIAEKRDARREIVVNPATGVILRDYIIFLAVRDDNDDRSGLPGEYDGDEYDDDYEDDDSSNSGSGSDNSGSGSENSGSGSSNSGSGSDNSGSGSDNSGSGSDDDPDDD